MGSIHPGAELEYIFYYIYIPPHLGAGIAVREVPPELGIGGHMGTGDEWGRQT